MGLKSGIVNLESAASNENDEIDVNGAVTEKVERFRRNEILIRRRMGLHHKLGRILLFCRLLEKELSSSQSIRALIIF